MIIVDTNIWIDHFHHPNPVLSRMLEALHCRVHPYVIGEIVLGSLKDRAGTLETLQDMPQAEVALHDEVLRLITDHRLHGLGIGYVDAHLLASARLMPGARVWTRDRRLATAAGNLGVAFTPSH